MSAYNPQKGIEEYIKEANQKFLELENVIARFQKEVDTYLDVNMDISSLVTFEIALLHSAKANESD
ncbi:hypothetical protein DASB73_023030 [Starmerella bacillaris]|uniref:Uncharacterized protein n=1 Tax=Starmerella bacillaris TaxID=1247836 RepID=A0AAV5RIZ1_STABA|nr:hypothetical protein DASB73_023030 [Starmerella bacillaris]